MHEKMENTRLPTFFKVIYTIGFLVCILVQLASINRSTYIFIFIDWANYGSYDCYVKLYVKSFFFLYSFSLLFAVLNATKYSFKSQFVKGLRF